MSVHCLWSPTSGKGRLRTHSWTNSEWISFFVIIRFEELEIKSLGVVDKYKVLFRSFGQQIEHIRMVFQTRQSPLCTVCLLIL